MLKYILMLMLLSTSLLASNTNAKLLAKKFSLSAGSKASIQWERVFSSQRHLKKYKLNSLSQNELKILKKYLIKHAADSDQPTIPGL